MFAINIRRHRFARDFHLVGDSRRKSYYFFAAICISLLIGKNVHLGKNVAHALVRSNAARFVTEIFYRRARAHTTGGEKKLVRRNCIDSEIRLKREVLSFRRIILDSYPALERYFARFNPGAFGRSKRGRCSRKFRFLFPTGTSRIRL